MTDEDETGTSHIPRPQTSLRPDTDEDDEPVPGHIPRKRLAAVLGASSTVFVITAITFIGVGTVLGASLGPGIGGFVASFEEVDYQDGDAEIYPVLGEEPACDEAPQLEANLDGTTHLSGQVQFYKDLPLPDAFEEEQIARLSIVADSGEDSIEVEDLNLRLTALNAEQLIFDATQIREFGPDDYAGESDDANYSFATPGEGSLNPDDPRENVPEFGIDATSFILPDGGSAAAHQVSLGSIDLKNLNLYIAIGDKSDFNNPVERVVEPTERDCEALANS